MLRSTHRLRTCNIRAMAAHLTLALLCVTCGSLRSPAASAPLSHPNAEAIRQIKPANPADFSFVFLGDNKGSDDLFSSILRAASKETGVAFVFDDGDLVPSGKKAEFQFFLDQVRDNLKLPLLTAIGNHEIKSSGDLYQQIFGPTHYSFRIGTTAFIVADDASEKLSDAEAQWLTGELKTHQDCTNRFVILHVPPYDPRPKNSHCLKVADAKRLMTILKQGNVTKIFAGHIHGYYTGEWDGIPFVISGGAGADLADKDPEHGFYHYLTVHVQGSKVEMQTRKMEPTAAKLAATAKTTKTAAK